MWFKKKSVLQADGHYNSNTAYDGTDWRTTSKNKSWSVSRTLPSVADAGKYFYLPALGTYDSGWLGSVGAFGHYWSSSASPLSVYGLGFNSGLVIVGGNNRYYGCRVDWPE